MTYVEFLRTCGSHILVNGKWIPEILESLLPITTDAIDYHHRWPDAFRVGPRVFGQDLETAEQNYEHGQHRHYHLDKGSGGGVTQLPECWPVVTDVICGPNGKYPQWSYLDRHVRRELDLKLGYPDDDFLPTTKVPSARQLSHYCEKQQASPN
mmetsp:Transcript_2176/g.7769  ORF Transcript_2176/g.7769 Transcript_2176/m.7769 type:complete len:153 (-) Transcript_2176:221-679(-)